MKQNITELHNDIYFNILKRPLEETLILINKLFKLMEEDE